MRRIAKFITDHPLIVAGVIALVSIVLLRGVFLLEMRASVSDQELPASDSILKEEQRIREIFGNQEIVILAIETENIFNVGTLTKVKEIGQEIQGISGIRKESVASIATIRTIKIVDGEILAPPVLDEIPTTPAEMEELRNLIRQDELIYGRLVSTNENAALIVARLEDSYSEKDIYESMLEVQASYEGPEKIHLSGSPIVAKALEEGTKSDLFKLFPMALLVISCVFFVSFRKLSMVFVPFVVVILGTVWMLGLIGYLGIPFSPVTSATPVILIALGSSYAIHLVLRHYEEYRKGSELKKALREATAKTSFPILIAGITTTIGFLSFLMFEISSIREFGIITAIGILATLFLSIVLIPALMSLFRISGDGEQEKSKEHSGVTGLVVRLFGGLLAGLNELIGKILAGLTRFILGQRCLLLVGLLGLIFVSVLGISRMKIGIDPYEFFPKGHEVTHSNKFLNDEFSASGNIVLVLETPQKGDVKDLEFIKKVLAFQEEAGTIENVGYTNSYAGVLARIIKLLGMDIETVDQSVVDLIFQGLAESGEFSNLVDEDLQRAKISAWLNTTNTQDTKSIFNDLREISSKYLDEEINVFYGGDKMMLLRLNDYIVKGEPRTIIPAVIAVAFVCGIVFRSIRFGILSVVPLGLAILITFGLMGWIGISLNLATAVIAGITIGVGVDFAIHYISRFREVYNQKDIKEALVKTGSLSGRPIIFDALSNTAGFSVFLLSGFVPLAQLGWLMVFIMITSALATLIFLPILLSFCFLRDKPR